MYNAVDDLSARSEDKISDNSGIQAAIPNPIPRNVAKPDVQEKLKNDRNDDNNDKNERNLDDHNNAASVKRADRSYPPGYRKKCNPTNHREAPSAQNLAFPVDKDFGSPAVVPSVVPAGKLQQSEKQHR